MDNTNKLELTISVKDDGSVVIDTVSKRTDDLGDATTRASSKASSALGGLKENWIKLAAGVTAAYFTIKKSIDVLNSFINEAAEAERIESRMAFQIEAVGIQYQKVNKYIDDYANAIQATTRFSDEMARESLGQMMLYTDNLGKAMTGAQLAMSMTTQTGKDLQLTTQYVGMAMEGNVEILGRWIPELKNLKEKLGENASEAEVAARAIEILNKMFSGAAQKDLSTYSAKLAQLKNQWSDIKEEMGRRLMPYMEDWIAGVQSILKISPDAAGAQNKLAESIKKAGEESKKAAAEKRGYEEITKYATLAEEAEKAYKMIGVVSAATLQEQVSKTLWAVEKIREAWKAGKASALDYANAVKAATEILTKVTGEDPTKKLVDAYVESQKKIAEISFDDPERKQKIQAIIDDWMKARSAIQSTPPISITADISGLEAAFNSAREKYESLRATLSQPIAINARATIESSPKVPFSKGIENMILKFGSLRGAIKSIEANIRFAEFTEQLKPLTKELAKVRDIVPSIKWAQSLFPTLDKSIDQRYLLQIKSRETDLLSQINIIKMKQTLSMLNMYGGSFQTGTQYVPRTALYQLHEGEKVIPKGVSFGDIHVSVGGGGDPKKTVDLLVKTLKYRLSGELKGLI